MDETKSPLMRIAWPSGKRFAFTVVDDTDYATLENVKPVYDLLATRGMRTTKTVWIYPGDSTALCNGASCEEPFYLEWLRSLRRQGFEIALHNAAASTSPREITRLALGRFEELFGAENLLFCNHTGCLENIYWGDARLSGWRRWIYSAVTRGQRRNISRGHIEGDPLFWGDLCQNRVRYVRNLVFDNLNVLELCPELPYHDPQKPYVNYWFPSTDGGNLNRFLANFTLSRLRRLQESGGLCIAYVHFGAGFSRAGNVNAEFRSRIEYLTSLDGWFAPASTILEFLRNGATTEERTIDPWHLARLELKWLLGKLLKGTS